MAAKKKSSEETKPAAKAKPPAKTKPAVKAKPEGEAKPVAQAKPAVPAQPAAKVKPIPEGRQGIIPHLIVRGSGQAIEFYQRAFGAVEVGRMPGPDGFSIIHAEIKIGDSFVFLADEMPQWGVKAVPSIGGTSCSLHLYVEDADTAFQRAVDAGATVKMPLQDMFWGDRYGKIVDPFGHEWSIATHKEDVSLEECGKRSQAMFAKHRPTPT